MNAAWCFHKPSLGGSSSLGGAAVLSSVPPGRYLLVVAVGQDPVLLLRVEEEAEDVERQAVSLIGRPLVQANEQAAFHLRVREQHDLRGDEKRKEAGGGGGGGMGG